MTSSSLSTSSAGYGWLVTLMLLCCLCLGGGGLAAFLLMKKKQKKKPTTDREAYLKNDFIERQPVYEEEEPMLKGPAGTDMNHDNRADMAYTGANMNHEMQAPVNPTHPTMQSLPVQVELAQPAPGPARSAAPVSEATNVMFPGLPPIGGGSTLLQQHRQTWGAQPQAASMIVGAQPQYVAAQPQATSMLTTQPYGNYTSQSAYVSAPSAYPQQGIYPGGGVV